ncbi:hypothetical protein [Streptomyces sp. PU_AKi4]|uniref:hypothetical protein n=1 Tax=Streptomyces sp. PU_AKi4 TaxID=2800809 RepID=UPI0035243448
MRHTSLTHGKEGRPGPAPDAEHGPPGDRELMIFGFGRGPRATAREEQGRGRA